MYQNPLTSQSNSTRFGSTSYTASSQANTFSYSPSVISSLPCQSFQSYPPNNNGAPQSSFSQPKNANTYATVSSPVPANAPKAGAP